MASVVTPTPPEIRARIERMFEDLACYLEMLYERWQDEKDYEDIEEYADVIRKRLPAGISLSQMHRRPFGFSFVCTGFSATYNMNVTAKGVAWKRITWEA
jgi:hypothetical protein